MLLIVSVSDPAHRYDPYRLIRFFFHEISNLGLCFFQLLGDLRVLVMNFCVTATAMIALIRLRRRLPGGNSLPLFVKQLRQQPGATSTLPPSRPAFATGIDDIVDTVDVDRSCQPLPDRNRSSARLVPVGPAIVFSSQAFRRHQGLILKYMRGIAFGERLYIFNTLISAPLLQTESPKYRQPHTKPA